MGRIETTDKTSSWLLSERSIIGRSHACTVRLWNACVSAEHALLRWNSRAWELQDLGSRNGASSPAATPCSGQQLPLSFADRDAAEPEGPPESKAPRRIGWASLLARVFAVDVTVCRKCGGRMRILEVVDTPDAVDRVLHGARAPPRPPPPGQLLLLR